MRTMNGETDVTAGPELTVQIDPDSADEAMMSMLHEHVPLSLLCDLTAPEGPESEEILAEEGTPDTRWWEQ
jgi:hypothetical protein